MDRLSSELGRVADRLSRLEEGVMFSERAVDDVRGDLAVIRRTLDAVVQRVAAIEALVREPGPEGTDRA